MKKKSSLRDKISKNIDRQEKAQSSYGYLLLPKNVGVFSPEPNDKVSFDILMYEVTDPKHMDRDEENDIAMPGTLWWKRPFKTHRSIGVGNDTVVCLSSIGKRCPICEYRAKRIKEGAEKLETDALRPSLRNLYAVIPIGHKEYDESKIHILDISQYNFQKLLNDELKENPDHVMFMDLDEGETLKVRFVENSIGKGQPFPVANRIDFIERSEQYGEEFAAKVPNLDELLKIMSYAELEAKFLEVEGEEDGGKIQKVEEEEVIERPRKSFVKDEDEDEDDKPSKASTIKHRHIEDEDAPPVKKTLSSIKRKSDDEEEEDAPKAKVEGKKYKCPYGYKFGVDTEAYDECDDCEIWKECLDAKKKNK